MKLTAFSVEKFRSIILPSSFSVYNKTVLLGPNNEGKSNVLRALVFALEFIKEFAFHKSSYIKTGDDELIYEIPLLHRIRYEWHTDYPISNQKMFEPADEKHSTFILQFSFTSDHDSEILERIDLKEDAVISLKINAGYESAKISFCKENHRGNYSEFKQLKSICQYIASRIDICYIDAIRTIDSGKKNIQSLIDLELKEIYVSEEYKAAQKAINKLRDNALNSVSQAVVKSLENFIPNVKKVLLQTVEYGSRSMRNYGGFDVLIDDGELTSIEQKGSGIQSLFTISMLHHISQKKSDYSDVVILVIEEPEAHLHPKAIHEMREVLAKISENNQVIITTHSPLLVDTINPHKNIIVKDNCAKEACKISDIRNILGVTPSDNLSSAEMVILVEGAADENMFPHILSTFSPTLKSAIEERRLLVLSCGGTSHMENFVNFLRNQLCNIYIFVDDDSAGNQLIDRMKTNGSIQDSEYTILKMNGLGNSEIENILKPDIYASIISQKYGISEERIISTCSADRKWSTGMENLFREFGKSWNEDTAKELKTLVSEAVKSCAELQLIEHRKHALVAGCLFLEQYFKG